MEECRQFVKNKLQTRGSTTPFEFVRTAPCHNPHQSAASNIPSGECWHYLKGATLTSLMKVPYYWLEHYLDNDKKGIVWLYSKDVFWFKNRIYN